ncbi:MULTISPECIES: hypothetical protein [unclassified Marinobacter]|uniref:hypothetical protein n=1 Tax=unclassified Marinobacter TaxID=83889 RepID=UPI001925EA1E|nr:MULTISPECIES: hypothetical protein [unclassified Marinobacter]MBL3825148.1 hypothetical protein [Marinobacter sp. MC3]MBL3893648.1 hypothetical protein [Marinobacter sp. MW3]
MSNVIDLDSMKPHLSGPAICTECQHEWQAVMVKERDAELMECPSCRKFFGVMRGPQVPDTMWRCKCGSNLFYLTTDGHQCRSCGKVSLDWCNA